MAHKTNTARRLPDGQPLHRNPNHTRTSIRITSKTIHPKTPRRSIQQLFLMNTSECRNWQKPRCLPTPAVQHAQCASRRHKRVHAWFPARRSRQCEQPHTTRQRSVTKRRTRNVQRSYYDPARGIVRMLVIRSTSTYEKSHLQPAPERPHNNTSPFVTRKMQREAKKI